MIPSAGVDGDPRHTDLHQSASHQEPLAKVIPPVFVAHLLVLTRQIKRRLSRTREHQIDALLKVLIEGDCRIVGQAIGIPSHRVECSAQFTPTGRPPLANLRREHHVAHLEVGRVGLAIDHKGRVLATEKIGSAAAGHRGNGHVGWQAVPLPALPGNHRPERRMERDVRSASHGHRRRGTGHQVMVAAAVIGVFVAD